MFESNSPNCLKPAAAMSPHRHLVLIHILASDMSASVLTIVLLLIQLVSAWLSILANSPYPSHIDEPYLMKGAATILKTGDLNPHSFDYPSLPVYLASATMGAGYLSATSMPPIGGISADKDFAFPYYSYPRMTNAAKLSFASLGVFAAFLVGLAMRQAYRQAHLSWIVPQMLSFSKLYTAQLMYINPNIIAVFFANVYFAQLAWTIHKERYTVTALVPGTLVGLTAACKYNFGVLVVSPIAALFVCPRTNRFRKLTAYVLVAIGTFVAVTPYSVLDAPHFLMDVVADIDHYGAGHPGFERDPGWPQVCFMARSFYSELGPVILGLALLGIASSCRANRAASLIFCIYSVELFVLMSIQRTNFMRNLLPVYVMITMYAGFGLTTLFGYARRCKEGVRPVVGLTLLFCLLNLPWRNAMERIAVMPDSRNIGIVWINNHIPAGSTLVVAEELGMDCQSLRGSFRVVMFRSIDGGSELNYVARNINVGYLIVPRFGSDNRFPLTSDSPKRINDYYRQLVPLVRFGNNDVLVNYVTPVPGNSPRFSIMRYDKYRIMFAD